MDTPRTPSPRSGDGERDSLPGVRPAVPRWVKVFGLLALLLVVVLVTGRLLGIEHGPGMHGASAATAAPVSSAESSWDSPTP